MTDFGSDISCTDDLSSNLEVVTGTAVILEALVRRLRTPRGGLFYDLEYGTDVRQYVNSSTPLFRVAQAVEAECLKDERVEAATATVTRESDRLMIEVAIDTADEPFVLTIGVDALTSDLITFTER